MSSLLRGSAVAVGALVALVGAAVASAAPPQAVIDRGAANANAHADKTHLGPGQALSARDAIVDANGTEHVRFDRTFEGMRVLGGDFVVHTSAGGAFLGVSETLTKSPELRGSARITPGDALRTAAARFDGTPTGSRSVDKIVYARDSTPFLAYEAVVSGEKADGSDSELHVIVDATYGSPVDEWDAVENIAAPGTGNGFYGGTVVLTTDQTGTTSFALRDPSRGNQYTCDMNNKTRSCYLFNDADNLWGNGTLSSRQSVAVDAQYGTAETWDYYKTTHGRNGIGNDGRGSYNRVHYSRGYNNAYWSDSCFCMTYGDGHGVTYNPFDSLDVAGHEMSHGVTSRTANLTYSGESGGLNEGNSDIFGTQVEYYANNVNDTPDYKIGEKLYVSNPGETKALRYMWRPSADGASADCWYSGVGALNVHYSSGVANHFFFLLAAGTAPSTASNNESSPTCVAGNTRVATGSASLAGIGNDAAAKIWYRALTVYMTSSTNYAQARAATLQAATDLGGQNNAAVAAAWSAVNVN